MAHRPRPVLSRSFLLVLLALLAASGVATVAYSSSPSSGQVDLEDKAITWTGKELGGPSRSAACGVDGSEATPLCDEYELTVDVDPKYWESFKGGVEVGAVNDDADDDHNILVYDAGGALVSTTNASGPGQQEKIMVPDASRAGSPYRVVVYQTAGDGGTYDAGARIEARAEAPNAGGAIPTEPVSDAKCVDGRAAGVFPCEGVDLDGFLPLDEIGGGQLNDIWGWTDPDTGREYALVGKTNGTAFVDVTEPTRPKYLGQLPTFGPESPVFNIWRDLKVYADHVFVVSEEPAHGMQVFDLKRLRGVTEPQTFTEDVHYPAFGNAHNISINEATGFAYVIGTNTCRGGSHIVDVRDPRQPKPAGCVLADGYTHDNQCVVYDGPDTRYTGREICFDFNEDTVTIVDVTDKLNPRQLSRTGYDTAQYTHQGWVTEDHRHVLFNDELDEQGNGTNTTTRILNVDKLDNPAFVGGGYVHPTAAIDHNSYIKGDRAYQSNYRAGLRVLDTTRVAEGQLDTLAFFDVYPEDDAAEFNGTWSNYPYFRSGTIVATGIEQGLFVLREQSPQSPAPAGPDPEPGSAPAPSSAPPGALSSATGSAGSTASSGSSSAATASAAAATAVRRTTPRVALTRAVRPGRRLAVGCRVAGARQRSCVVTVLTRRSGRLRTLTTLRFRGPGSRTIRLGSARDLVLRAEAVTTMGRKLRASRALRLKAGAR